MGTGILAAYGFARGNFPLKNTLFILVLGALMIPHQVTFVPIYILVANLGWIDTFAGLVLPTSVSAYLIFMLRQNFMSVDQSYLDAGKIDGLGIIGTLRHILIPMCRSSVATVAFVTVMDGWNNYFWPKILSKTEQTRPISVGLVMLKNSFEQSVQSQNYNVVMAAAAAVSETLTNAGVAYYTGADSFVTAGALATCGVNYTDLGTKTADMALDVLQTGTVPEYHVMEGGIITVNTETAAALGIDPAAYADLGGTLKEVVTAAE